MPQAAIPIAASVAGSAVGSLLGKGGGGGSSGGNVSTTQQQLDPEIKARLLALMDRAQGVADAPYVPYGGPRVAGFSPDQESGFQQVRDYATAGIAPNLYAQGITGQETEFDPMQGPTSIPEMDLTEYLNPFTDLVAGRVEDEMRRYGAISDREADAKAAMTGAFGGDRAGIVKTEMERNREATLGNTLSTLYKGGYDTATGLATADLNRRLQAGIAGSGIRLGAAQQLAQLGAQEQSLGLQGAAALENVGAQQQGLLQRNYDTAYSDFLEQREYPFKTTNFLAGIVHGSPVNREGTTTSTTPAPSMLGQIAGLGASAIGLAGATGGFGANGWLSSLFGGGTDYSTPPYAGGTGSGVSYGLSAARGGLVRRYDAGGFVTDEEFAGIGAPVDVDELGEPVDPEYAADLSGRADAEIAGLAGDTDDDAGSEPDDDEDDVAGIAPPMAGELRDRAQGSDRTAGIGSAREVQRILRTGVGQPDARGNIPSWALPLTVAGFAMMASKNPSALGAVGEGGIAGIKTYVETKKLDALDQYRRDQIEARREQIRQTGAYRAGQLQVSADKNQVAREKLDSEKPKTESQIELNKARAAQAKAAAARHFDAIGTGKFTAPVAGEGLDEKGNLIKGAYTLDQRTGVMKFVAGAVITGRGGAGGGKTALEKNTEYVAARLAAAAGRDAPNEADRAEALKMVQQGKDNPESRARLETGILRDLRKTNAEAPRKERKTDEQLKAQAAAEAREALTRARSGHPEPAPTATAAPKGAPAGFTQRVVSKSGKVGWKNPETNQVWTE